MELDAAYLAYQSISHVLSVPSKAEMALLQHTAEGGEIGSVLAKRN